ncbi:MAG TPA: ATPase [Geobacteraceae bacterium]|nr:ATPase [Geobacteraceae bacterium]
MVSIGKRLLKDGIVTEKELEEALERQRQKGGRLGQNLVALGFIKEDDLNNFFKTHPAAPTNVEETGLTSSFIADLIMKHILFIGEFRISDVVERVKLPVSVVDAVLETLKRDRFVEVKGGTGYATVTYTFKITDQGKNRATELMDICRHVGPAPVTLNDYSNIVELQSIKNIVVSEEKVRDSFSHLVLSPSLLKRLGPAISSGKAIFIYGPPGNGKTAIAETISTLLPDTVYIPYSLTVGGQIISMFDPVNHVPAGTRDDAKNVDQRWVQIKRPVVITGGELSLRMLDLDFNPISKYYEASLQMKANNGVFVADDFGRQQIDPQNLLNRWIVPLDRNLDYMTLHTGMKFAIPFNMLVIFSTNIEPRQLVDEAFLRRIRYKINVGRPSETEYEAIFKKVCASNLVPFDKDAFDYLMNNYYRRLNVDLNACHPRDILDHIVDSAHYYMHAPLLTREGIDVAWQNYFVDM